MEFTPSQVRAVLIYCFGESNDFTLLNIRREFGNSLTKEELDKVIEMYSESPGSLQLQRPPLPEGRKYHSGGSIKMMRKLAERRSKNRCSDRVEAIGRLRYEGHKTLQEIADVQDPPVTREYIRQLCDRYAKVHDLEPINALSLKKAHEVESIDVEELRKLINTMSTKELADHFGTSIHIMLRVIRANGVKRTYGTCTNCGTDLHTPNSTYCLKPACQRVRRNLCAKELYRKRVERK